MRNFLLLLLLAPSLFAETFDAGDGVRLWYAERGKGSPVIVIHGGPGMDHFSLAADLGPLEKRHRVIYYDQRGGGGSSLPSDTALLTIDHHVRDLEALRQHLGLEKITLLAHSFGPAIAAQYAIRYPAHVEHMIFLSPIPPRRGTFGDEYGKRLRTRLTDAQIKRAEELSFDTDNVTAVCREYWSIMTPPRVAKSISPTVVKSDLCAAPPNALRFGMTKTNPATFGSLGDWNWTADLAKVNVPTLILHGDEDAIPMAMVNEWITAMPNARIVRLEKTAHFPHAERPTIVFPAIETFLRGDWPKSATRK
ncbi:MAG TPA: alpha/beta fold hydrolase [Thermoanaerobaculia bacterium]|nr:alpha/beta fold hydrolase [Thermoanaerobaculia bacterium]